MSAAQSPSIVIIGAGISGILMAIKLRERGYGDIIILEKGVRLGGTWRDNTYPGVACDVAAHLYTYSFAHNPWWKTRYAKGKDIWNYYNRVAQRYGVTTLIQYRKEVSTADFDGAAWLLKTTDGTVYRADIVVAANGRLHHPKMPEIKGLDSFAGARFHTSQWDHSVPLDGKRVGMIGTGSTATQVIVSLARRVGRLPVFQRTAQWVYPVADSPTPFWRKALFALSPSSWNRYFVQLQGETEARGKAATGSAEGRRARDQVCYDALAAIRDPVLRAKLTPNYEVGCKRLVFSDGFYEAIQQPTVDLVTESIDHVVPQGIVTKDGKLHELDVLVLATGFDSHAYLRPMALTGENGIPLDEVWADLPLTHHSMTIPHMPNFLLLNGPYSPGGSASVVGIVEVQVAYLLQLVDQIVQKQVLIAPKAEVARAWLEHVRERARHSVWGSGGCDSWYVDKTGTPTLNPMTLSELKAAIAEPIAADFIERPIPAAQLDSKAA